MKTLQKHIIIILSADRRNTLASRLKGILHRGIYKETSCFFRPNTDRSYDQTQDLTSSAAKKYTLMCDRIKPTTFQVSSTETVTVNQQILSAFLPPKTIPEAKHTTVCNFSEDFNCQTTRNTTTETT